MTALVTPFTAENTLDIPALERLTEHVIATGSDGIVVNGSTGESPTLSHTEKLQLLNTVRQTIGSRPVKLVMGTGTNDTAATIDFSQEVWRSGLVDALLVVVPYYNKPSQAGMLAHFGAIAQAVEAPQILYNIPGRCVVNMLPETIAALANRHNNIIGVKQSNGDMDQVSEIRRQTPQPFQIWSGDDSLTLPMMALGGCGVISVASHLVGSDMRRMIQAFKQGDAQTALSLHLQHLTLFKQLFSLPNPTVLKACLARLGLIQLHLRLPLMPPTEAEFTSLIDPLMQGIQIPSMRS